jgi:hypothetical protein
VGHRSWDKSVRTWDQSCATHLCISSGDCRLSAAGKAAPCGPRSADATKHEAVPIHHVAAVIRSLHLATVMACPNYKKLQQECETYRRQLGEFHLMKFPNWQRDDKTLWLVRGKAEGDLGGPGIDGLALDQLRRMQSG